MVVANMEFLDNVFSSKRLESTLAAHILGTLLQAHEQKAVEGVQHNKEAKVVYMAGHDTWADLPKPKIFQSITNVLTIFVPTFDLFWSWDF